MSIFSQLLPELEDRIFSLLEPNEVACTLRLISRAAAARLRGPRHTTVRLSLPVPPHAFAARWARPDATSRLALRQRQQLLHLTAASGVLANLKLLLPRLGFCALESPSSRATLLETAAKAGQLGICRWLRDLDLNSQPLSQSVLEAGGSSGSWELCEWLLSVAPDGAPVCVIQGAARAGHVRLVDRLLASYGSPPLGYWPFMLPAAAEGCDLATLQRLHAAFLPSAHDTRRHSVLVLGLVDGQAAVCAAAASPTPDWRAKVEWLAGECGYPRCAAACAAAAGCEDALDRLAWLAERGFPLSAGSAAQAAARRGDPATLLHLAALISSGSDPPQQQPQQQQHTAAAMRALATHGHLHAVRQLHALHAWPLSADLVLNAACRGHLELVAWLVGEGGGALGRAVLTPQVVAAAAGAGSLPLLAWLRVQGCGWPGAAWAAAAGAGSEEVLEWLAAEGCPMEDPQASYAYVNAAANGDTATLACLRRLGVPWDGATLPAALRHRAPLPALTWLLREGCPVEGWAEALCPVEDWAEALRVARAEYGAASAGRLSAARPEQPPARKEAPGAEHEVVAWLAAERQRRAPPPPPPGQPHSASMYSGLVQPPLRGPPPPPPPHPHHHQQQREQGGRCGWRPPAGDVESCTGSACEGTGGGARAVWGIGAAAAAAAVIGLLAAARRLLLRGPATVMGLLGWRHCGVAAAAQWGVLVLLCVLVQVRAWQQAKSRRR